MHVKVYTLESDIKNSFFKVDTHIFKILGKMNNEYRCNIYERNSKKMEKTSIFSAYIRKIAIIKAKISYLKV